MRHTHETLVLEATGSRADALTPGAVQSALFRVLGLRSEELGVMSPLGRGVVEVEIGLARALQLVTPLPLSVSTPTGPALLTLRRHSDPAEVTRRHARITWTGRPRIGPSLVARALTQATEGCFHPEDLGVCFEGQDIVLIEPSEGLLRRLSLPAEIRIDGATLTIDEATR